MVTLFLAVWAIARETPLTRVGASVLALASAILRIPWILSYLQR
jgi:hypothetical protein